MYVLNFWHTVPDFEAWKKLFDDDPLGREASGVRRYTLVRPVDDEQTVVGELQFDTLEEVYAFAGRLRDIWTGPASGVVANAGLRISRLVEEKELHPTARQRAA